ncbi:MAG: hypothetical protein ACE5PT_00515 [Gemmatimonadales bacterium]
MRPYLTPLPLARIDTLRGDPSDIVTHLADVLAADSIRVRVMTSEEGYLETRRFDARFVQEDSTRAPISPIVRLRFWIDPVGEGEAQVTAEVVTERTMDPSLPERQREIMVPPGHPGWRVLERILAALHRGFPR